MTTCTRSVKTSSRPPHAWCAGFPKRMASASASRRPGCWLVWRTTGRRRISELALAENCSQPTITNHVKRLEAAHLVDRTADPRDARAWMIKLTKKGNQQLSLMRDSIGTSLEPYLATMSRRDLKALREGVRGDAPPDGRGDGDATVVTQQTEPDATSSAFRLYDTATRSVRPFEPVCARPGVDLPLRTHGAVWSAFGTYP